MNGHTGQLIGPSASINTLSKVCYRTPDGASFQQAWREIRISEVRNSIRVIATADWVTPNDSGHLVFRSEYRVANSTIHTLAFRKQAASRSEEK
ncbi:hypothetical protein I5803_14235 [Caenimonas sp. DR4.4]|uniref:Uncharacterized protein n=2 Tax=Caenimonas aquaedulcis TaxID=2793270 RepID=A0A931H6A5_9BURK|nr:hypothetical protein [Caenimonas aquaedulcis]